MTSVAPSSSKQWLKVSPLEAIASRLQAIAIRLDAIAFGSNTVRCVGARGELGANLNKVI